MSDLDKLNENFKQGTKGSSLVWKIISIIVIIIILSITTFSIQGLIKDRIDYKKKVLSDIGIQWGSPKTILGPALKIPYQEPVEVVGKNGKTKLAFQEKFIYILPEKLTVNSDLNNKELYRGIYKENVYNTDLSIRGSFVFSETVIKMIAEKPNLDLDKAALVLSINEIKSFKSNLKVELENFSSIELDKSKSNGKYYELSSTKSFLFSLADLRKISEFKLDLALNGSRKFEIIPGAKEVELNMVSNWPHPSFSGAYLPETRDITEKGFNAKWKVFSILDGYESLASSSFNTYNDPYRSYDNHDIRSASFGVELFSPSNIYTKTERSLKYGFLFIILTFSMYFLIEVLFKQRFHQFQYLMIGLAVSIFYLLLLSFAEHLGFDFAYIIAALGVTSLIGFYTNSVVEKKILSVITVSLIALLYAYLYLLLQLTDYSLLFGSIGLFAVLSAVMIVSRKIDWYKI